MIKSKKFILLVILLLVLLSVAVSGKIVNAKTTQAENIEFSTENADVIPRGLYTKMGFSLDGGDGQVWFTAKNQFTLFSSTVTVQIELYRSDTYQEDFANMNFVAYNYIYDLDQGKTLTASASTDGKQSYWKARAYYKIDNKDWQETISDTILFNADGMRIF